MQQALIIIDVQQSFTQRPFWDEAELPAFLHATQTLADTCREQGIAMAQVFHESTTNDARNPFARASGLVTTLPGLALMPDRVFHKTVHSALFARDEQGHSLHDWLTATGIEEVLICGIRTEQCCETTARHASDAGFQVRYLMDATLTFAMRSREGRLYTPQAIKAHTELVLADRFATVQTVEQWTHA